MEFLESKGARFGSTSQITNLIVAAAEGDIEEVQNLLQYGKSLDVNQGDYDGRRAIHLAAGEGQLDVVKILCEAGAHVNVEDRWGNRPLDDARRAKRKSREVMDTLKYFGAKAAENSIVKDQQVSSTVSEHHNKKTDPDDAVSSMLERLDTAQTLPGLTPAYCPPELLLGHTKPNPATDMWSTGVIMVSGHECRRQTLHLGYDVGSVTNAAWLGMLRKFILLTGSHPFDKYNNMSDDELRSTISYFDPTKNTNAFEELKKFVFDERVDELSEDSLDLMHRLMHPDPKKRPTSIQFSQHPWIQQSIS